MRTPAAAALALAILAAAPASAKLTASTLHLLRAPVAAKSAVARTCSARALKPGAPGAVVRTVTVPLGGLLDARLNGSPHGGDWDLAVFDARNGRFVNGSAAFGGNEVVQAAVTTGDVLTIQACKRTANAKPVTLTVTDAVLSGTAPKPVRQSLVTIRYRTTAQLDRLAAQGIDFAENGHNGKIDAVLQGAADARKLRAAGMRYSVKIPDLVAYDERNVRTTFDPVGDLAPSGLPSGQRLYRHLIDYQNDLKQLVEDHPGVARAVILPGRSVEDRTLEGIELATNVDATDDGRPTHVEVGLHHVREWPSGEVTIEYAFTLAKGYEARTPRIMNLLDGERTFVIPVINPDGLEATQRAGDSIPVYDDNGVTSLPLAIVGQGPYRRKNCQGTSDQQKGYPLCELRDGIDLNRNYAAYWGGPGSGSSKTGQDYRGTAPFTEPESEAFHKFSSAHQVMVINSNHTYAGDFLFQPGFGTAAEPGLPYRADSKPIGEQVPHQKAMKDLSDAMGAAAGYKSFVSYNLYDVTGATEDWNYFAQSAFGYTAEVAWQDFHPNYQDGVIDQYLGTVDGPMDKAAMTALGGKGVDLQVTTVAAGPAGPSQGLQESYLLAGEAALDPANHAIIEGDAPPGATLKLTKDFTTATSYDAARRFQQIPEHLETTLTVPASGHYVWHVNPSSRPVALLAGTTEAWTLSCGDESRQVRVEMGERKVQNLACP